MWLFKLFAEVRAESMSHSIYRGKAIKLRFLDNDGDPLEMPVPEFMDVERIDESLLVYPDDIEEAIGLSDRILVMTDRPGRIKSEYRVELPRPRDLRG